MRDPSIWAVAAGALGLTSGAIVPIASQKPITGAEALLRWTHPVRGQVAPAVFIPVAEDCGLIAPISNWVLRQACEQGRAWMNAGLPLSAVAVHISPVEFGDINLLDRAFTALSDAGLDPRCLELELTETVLMKRDDVDRGDSQEFAGARRAGGDRRLRNRIF